MHPCCAVARRRSASAHIMEWRWADEWPLAPEDTSSSSCEEHKPRPAPKPPDPGGPAHAQPYPSQSLPYPFYSPTAMEPPPPPGNIPILKGETPRELRNKAEKQRRDKLSKSITELSKIVPPVLAMNRKVDKTSVLRLTAHYLRSHQYVFGDSLSTPNQFGESSIGALMSFLNGFIITTTYKGLVVVVSPNVQKYLGYTELELIGHNILNIIHEEDRQMMSDQLMPKSFLVGSNDEILFPEDTESKEKVAEALANERRSFNVRFRRNSQRSQPHRYINCHIQGSFRKSDKASLNNSRHYQLVRRLRTRCPNWCTSGNDVVFIGLVRPSCDTFETESKLESCLMEYRTRHSIDGEIISCDARISIATGYMANEVKGINAMNFMHRDDVRWVIVALREMYDQHRLSGESCYRLITKCGKFVYMRTKGYLEVDKDTGAVTSFVCINTVVDKVEGKKLNMAMKKKFMILVNNTDETPPEDDDDDDDEVYGTQGLPVEDPRQLQKVILHLVTNLPSPSPDTTQSNTPFQEERPPYRLCIIPPKRERIFNAIDKIYNVIECFKHSSKYLRYTKQKMSKRPLNEENSNPKKPKKRKKPEKPPSESNSPTSNNENPIPGTSTSQNIEPHCFYPDLIPGTTTEISPQAGPSGLQRPIDPLLLQRLYDYDLDYKTVNLAQVSNTSKDSIKTYALMIPAIISRKFCNYTRKVVEEHRYVQPLSPTPNLDINEQSIDTSNPLQSYEVPSATSMEESNISAPRDPGTGSHTPHTSSLSSSKINNDHHSTSTIRSDIPPPYFPQNWLAELQPGPSRTSILPIQSPPLQYPPVQPPPVQHPPIQPPPLQHPPLQLPPIQPTPLEHPPIQPTPLQHPPIQPTPLQYPPIQPTPLQHPPIQPTPLQYPPIQPTPLQPTPIQPTPLQHPPIQPSPLKYPPIQPTPLQYLPIQPLPLEHPPIQPTPLQNPPIQPSPLQYLPLQPTPIQYPPLQPTPLQYPPLQPAPIQYPPIQPTPLQHPPIQHPPIQPTPLQYPPIQPTPLQHPPIQPPPLQHPPIQPTPLHYPPIQPPSLQHPPIQPTPLQYLPIQPPPQQHPPIQPTPLQYPPLQPTPIQYPPLQPIPLQYPPIQYPPLQPTPLQYPPLQPTPLQYAPIQPTPLQYPPLQPTPLQYPPLQPTPLANYYIPLSSPYYSIPVSPMQNYSISPFPIPNYSIQPSPIPNYAVPSFTQNYPVLLPPIPSMPYPFDPLWRQVIPTYMGQFYQSEPYTEVRRNSFREIPPNTTEAVALPITSQYIDTTDTSVYFQEEIIPQSTNITQDETMESLEGVERPSNESFDDVFLDDLVRSHISQHIYPDVSTLEQQEQPLSVSEDPFVMDMDIGFELPTGMEDPISAEMPSTSNPSFASPSVVRAAPGLQYNNDKLKTVQTLLDEINATYRSLS